MIQSRGTCYGPGRLADSFAAQVQIRHALLNCLPMLHDFSPPDVRASVARVRFLPGLKVGEAEIGDRYPAVVPCDVEFWQS